MTTEDCKYKSCVEGRLTEWLMLCAWKILSSFIVKVWRKCRLCWCCLFW